MNELNKYRAVVRKIQFYNAPRHKDMKFEVPAAIKVGMTVTAFNRRYRILHRGMVLAYDIPRNLYLVQFERKELGFEFCEDTEVASHGVPELLENSSELALDGSSIGGFADFNREQGSLLSGTCYDTFMSKSRR